MNDLDHRIPPLGPARHARRTNLLTCPSCKHQVTVAPNVLALACPNCKTEMRVRPMEVQR